MFRKSICFCQLEEKPPIDWKKVLSIEIYFTKQVKGYDEYAKYVGYVFPISPCMHQFQLAIQTTLRRKDVGTSNMFWAK